MDWGGGADSKGLTSFSVLPVCRKDFPSLEGLDLSMVEARGANSPLRKIGVPDNLPNSKCCQIGDEHHSSNEIEVIPDHFGRSTLPLIFRRIHPRFLGSLQSIANKISTGIRSSGFSKSTQ